MASKHFSKPCPICDKKGAYYERTLNSTDLIRCSECDFVYSSLNDEEIKEINSQYNDNTIARTEEHKTFIDTKWFERIVIKITKILGPGKVLDVGCGNGLLLKHFINHKWSAYGIDLSQWSKRSAQRYDYTLYTCELENADLPENYFDAVTSTSTLEHIPRPLQHIKEIIRILKPGGVAYFAGIPNYRSLSIRLNISNFGSNVPPRHANYFTPKSMCRLFFSSDIAENIKKLIINTYGIPELHRIYHSVQKVMRRTTKDQIREPSDSVSIDKPPKAHKPLESLSRRAAAAMLLTMYYYLGRPFHLGSKLEVMAIKR